MRDSPASSLPRLVRDLLVIGITLEISGAR
jgi:hypothetical protein